jgi:hypothetical protein
MSAECLDSQARMPAMRLTRLDYERRQHVSKFKPYSRRMFNRRIREWVGKNLKLLAVLTLGLISSISLVTVVIAGFMPHVPLVWWALGVAHAGLVAMYLLLVQASFFAHDREAVVQLRGAWGEDTTRSELLRAKRRRHVWGWVDSIQLQGSDIDHLVVTRRGGLIAIDSKWRNQGYDIAEMAKSARKAGVRAEALARSVLARERRVRHRSAANPLAVTPLVVLWGAAQHEVPPGYRAEGVEFIAGRRLVKWLATLDTEAITKTAARDLIARLREYRAGNWDLNARM